MELPRSLGRQVTSRLKIMSNLDITERRRPQDGRSVIRVDGTEVDLRVATMPTMFGETIVLRLLRKGSQQLDIGDLGLPPDDRELFEIALRRPQGLIVFTGPTGSGKTTSLYAGMSELADPVRNVLACPPRTQVSRSSRPSTTRRSTSRSPSSAWSTTSPSRARRRRPRSS
jgi:type II secretory ATPase GspE/PulE/Tfp pilus assembly ATPase PilB-like protein